MNTILNTLTYLSTHALLLIIAIIGIGFLIAFHELGHFIFAKIFNVSVPSFSIGFGPRLITKKIGETTFALSAIPLGGYVEIAGSHEPGQGEQKEAFRKDQRSFANKPFYQQVIILLGGIFFNLIFAWVVFSGLYYIGGPCFFSWCFNEQPAIYSIKKNSPALEAGLKPYDTIKSIDNKEVSTITQAMEIINEQAGKTVNITIERNNTLKDTQVKILDKTPKKKKPAKFGEKEKIQKVGSIGILWYIHPSGFVESLQEGFTSTWKTIQEIAYAFISLFNLFDAKTKSEIGGPVMLFSQVTQSLNLGFKVFMIILGLISVNLALFNILPFPIFDGGQVLFYSIEAARGKPLSIETRERIAYYTWMLVILLVIYLSYKDLFKIFGGGA